METNTSTIVFEVTLDENHIPEAISWKASENQGEGKCNSILLALWDEKERNTLRFDLWTKDMTVEEMKIFYHQSLLTMADTFERATGDGNTARDMREFCHWFAERLGITYQAGKK